MLKRIVRIMQITVLTFGVGLVTSLFLTNPSELGAFGITAWFTALLVVFVLILTGVLYKAQSQRTLEALLRALRRSFLIGVWLVALLALGSLRQLTIGDIILLTVLVVAIDFYMRRVQV